MNENEMKSLENQLRSLEPRRPSRGLKRRVFPGLEAARLQTSQMARALVPQVLRWLTPAAACLFVAVATLHQQSFPLASSGHGSLLMASNENYTTYLPLMAEGGENKLQRATFEWTNRSGFTSTVSSFRRVE